MSLYVGTSRVLLSLPYELRRGRANKDDISLVGLTSLCGTPRRVHATRNPIHRNQTMEWVMRLRVAYCVA
ncbi:predicted protein [Arabidopsis lyrata subsp. lyrata]|uniref:Predicted protein n=1 Tax=Arabidopsis lyrata subsp. lyrata TaxID=81972 RepID=D7L8R8_ARALL|nr:predicted protein [Arabidopsis lyrata subsp. lyrata]